MTHARDSFAIFNFATTSLGGSVQVADFELAAGSYTGAAASTGSTTTTVGTTTLGTTTVPTTTIPSTPPTSSPTGGVAQHWDQCGGTGWMGGEYDARFSLRTH